MSLFHNYGMANIVTTNNLTKAYRSKLALDHVTFDVQEGDILGLVGKNGAGKTTLIRVLTDVARPTSGSYTLFGKSDPDEICKARRDVAAMVETPAFFGYMDATQNLINRAILMNVKGDLKKYADDLLDFVGLSEVKNSHKRVSQFSLGMKQRLGIAIALMGDPKLLILDEPTNGLDPEGIVQIRNLLLRLNKEKGITIIVSSHILSELSKLATRYCFLKDGKVVKLISAEELETAGEKRMHICAKDNAKALSLLQEGGFVAQAIGEEILITKYPSSAEIMNLLIKNGVELTKFHEDEAQLESIYMELMEEER